MQDDMKAFVLGIRAVISESTSRWEELFPDPMVDRMTRDRVASLLDPSIDGDPMEILFAERNYAEKAMARDRKHGLSGAWPAGLLALCDAVLADDGTPRALEVFHRAIARLSLVSAKENMERCENVARSIPDRRPPESGRGVGNALMLDALRGLEHYLHSIAAGMDEAAKVLPEQASKLPVIGDASPPAEELVGWLRVIFTGLMEVEDADAQSDEAMECVLAVLTAVEEDDGSDESWTRVVTLLRRQMRQSAAMAYELALSRCG